MAPGISSGLTFAIKEELEDKSCVHTDNTGFMLAVSNPRDEPQIQRFGTALPYGREIYVSLYPEVILAEKDAKDVSMERRGCYFTDDKGDAYLDFYKKYSRQNCLEECFAKPIYVACNCAKVSSPGFPGRKLCSLHSVDGCVRFKEEQMHNEGLKDACKKCRPNCRDTKYRTSVTWSRMTEERMNYYKEMFHSTDYSGDKNITISVVNVYFAVDSVHPTRRSARYSTFEEVGLIGGTVSMITGLTLLDVIESRVLIAVIVVAKYKVWNNLGRMGGPAFNWKLSIPKFLRRNNRVVPEEIEMAAIQQRPQRQALPRRRPSHPMENLPGYLP
ncbi:pickpocket protein 28 [Folsomia candida]|nr:pickpocket protein 28 [Folsomia candida]